MAWYDYGVTQGFLWTDRRRSAHSGVDLGVPFNTPVTAPMSGTVLFAQCKPWGGQVDIAVVRGGLPYVVTVLHLHVLSVSAGQTVAAGQLLGYSGGDARGPCPTQMPKYSRGAHVHLELTLGTLGPYHGGPPYTISANSTTVDPMPLLQALRSGGVAGAASGLGAYAALDPSVLLATPVSAQPFDTIFALPSATVSALEAIPGLDNLIYKLHEVETFPGWKSLDAIAPLGTDGTSAAAAAGGIATGIGVIAGTVAGVGTSGANAVGQAAGSLGQLGATLNPGRLAYWIVGNLLGNVRAATLRLLYLSLGIILFLGLLIALGSAQAQENVQEIGQLVQEAGPIAEATVAAA